MLLTLMFFLLEKSIDDDNVFNKKYLLFDLCFKNRTYKL